MVKSFIALLFLGIMGFSCSNPMISTAQKLGYPEGTKLLIIHADDLGLAHSVNAATISALEQGAITSASIMVPCPSFDEIANYARLNPEADLGLHLTLTAEWENHRWGGVLPSSQIPTLLDDSGFLHATSDDVRKHADPDDVEKEIRAQVDRAIASGILPTHLDTHMGSVYVSPDLFERYLSVGKSYGIPVFIPYETLPVFAHWWFDLPDDDYLYIDRLFMASDQKPDQWVTYYTDIIQNLKPGLTEIIVHLAYDDPEMKEITVNHPDFGSAWRQRDFDFFTSAQAKKLLEDNDVVLIGYREIQEKMYP
jgi:predicted glycoside hydrolase/deacetylase ChbG (UPF0249 family)